MKYLKQFGIIVAFAFAGEILHRFLPLPIPAGIYGILLMFFGFYTGLVKVEQVRETSAFLLEIMPVMFVPPAVALMDSWGVLRQHLLVYLLITVLTTFAVMVVAGRVTQYIFRRSGKEHADE